MYLAENTTLIEDGKLYLAFPPLYKITEGKNTYFIKDNDAYKEFLIERIISKDAKLKTNDIRLFIAYKETLDYVANATMIPVNLLEQFIFADSDSIDIICTDLSKPDLTISYDEKLSEFTISGLFENNYIESRLPINDLTLMQDAAISMVNDTEITTDKPYDFIESKLTEVTPKYRNRLKGLGEMNAKDLYESTMDPETRTLIKVSYEDKDEDLESLKIFFHKKDNFILQRKKILLESRVSNA